MKESLWGYWLIVLGISVITIMMLIQNYTTVNQEDYYLLKEVTQAALYDAVDYNYYAQYGELKINREVFIEMFERRFAESVKNNKTYKTDFYEIYESPPKVSVRVSTETSSFSISNDITKIDINNDIDVVLEHNGTDIITREFYSLATGQCNGAYQKDALGYCTAMNTFSLNDNTFKQAASEYLNSKYSIDVDPSDFELISIEHVGNMSTNDDFIAYRDNYQSTYGIAYTSNDGRVDETQTITPNHYAKEIKDVVIITNKEGQFGWSLKFKCNSTTPRINFANGGYLDDACLLGLKYKIKFKYTD